MALTTTGPASFASSLERIAASILYYKGLQIKGAGRWPHVDSWFAEMERRDSYRACQSDWHTHVHDLPPQIGGCLASGTPEQLRAAAAIDGTDGVAWRLPLQPNPLEPLPARPLYMYLLKGVGSSFFFLCVVCASFQCRVNRSC